MILSVTTAESGDRISHLTMLFPKFMEGKLPLVIWLLPAHLVTDKRVRHHIKNLRTQNG